MIAVAEPGQIRVVHLDGDGSTIIKVEGATPRALGWTARDERIVYIGVDRVDAYGSAVHVVYVDGTHDTRLTPIASTPGLTFSFDEAEVSPDLLFNALEVANEFELRDRAVKILDRIHKIRDRNISDACKTGVFNVHESVSDPGQLKEAHSKWKDYVSQLIKLPIYRDPNLLENHSQHHSALESVDNFQTPNQ